jgi:hypothetical protein
VGGRRFQGSSVQIEEIMQIVTDSSEEKVAEITQRENSINYNFIYI